METKGSAQIIRWFSVAGYSGMSPLRSPSESRGAVAASRKWEKRDEGFYHFWKVENPVHENSFLYQEIKIQKAEEGKSPVYTNTC